MATIVTRAGKGAPLSHAEVDANFTGLNTDITNHVGSGGTAHAAASTSVAGFMSASDKTKLDGVAAGATANTGTVTGVTGTAPVVSSGGTAPAISMPAATASANGYMTSTYAAKLDGIAAGATANTGTVTSASVASANGFAGSVANASTTPAITVSTTVTGVLKGNGTAISAATAGTDYTTPTGAESLTNKALGSGTTLAADLTGGDFALTRTMLKDTGYKFYDHTAANGTSNHALDYTNGSNQRWAPVAGTTAALTVSNWPPTGNLGELLIEGVNLAAAPASFSGISWVKSDGTVTTTFASSGVTLQTSGTDFILLWTRDAGTTTYGKVVR